MREAEYLIPEGSFIYRKRGMGAEITGYRGLAGQVEIPETLPWKEETPEGTEGAEEARLPVIAIGKKVFLSKKYLRTVTVPESVEEVGDWAFAYCDSLRRITFAGRRARFGKDVFKDCPKLSCVAFAEERKEGCEGVGALMAAAVTQMDSPYLLNAGEAGSREWLGKWDARMTAILSAADDEGYSKQILCGEEDYESADLDTYLAGSRKKKVRLSLLRLLYPMELAPAVSKRLKEYLGAHTKGCRTEEAWQVIREEYGDRREFYQLFAQLGLFTEENAPAIIADIGENAPEMKAYFLKYQADHFTRSDFFGNLEL